MKIDVSETADAEGSRRRDLVERFLSERALTMGAVAGPLALAPDEVAFVSGSVTDGVADAGSDLDVFVLTDPRGFAAREIAFDEERAAQQQAQRFGILYFSVNGAEFDAEVHEHGKYVEIVEVVGGLDGRSKRDVERTFATVAGFPRGDVVSLLHRFRVGVPIANERAFAALRGKFDERNFLLWCAHYHLIESRDYLRGVKRSQKSGDVESAYLKLVRLCDAIADATLFLAGESIDRWKWRLPKLRRLGDAAVLQDFLNINFHLGAASLEERLATQLPHIERRIVELEHRLEPH